MAGLNPPKKLPWFALLDGYRESQGIRHVMHVSATWHESGGDFTYVQSTIESVEFNVKE